MKTLRLLLLVIFTFCATVLVLVASAHSADTARSEGRPVAEASAEKNQACSADDSEACSVERSQVPESEMAEMEQSQMQTAASSDEQEMARSMHSMSSRHMDMGPHMKMTPLHAGSDADRKRADEIVQRLRPAIEKYKDVRVAEREGFKEFLPNVPQQMYHFTNWRYAIEAAFRFDPEHPTSLLYEKHGSGYKLVGAMYTAPKRFSENELNQRVPLSVAQWHEHVNMCAPPKGREAEAFAANPQFGLAGAITTRQECDAAGGTFYPVVFNWMVHVYPFERDAADVWSAERQMAHKR